MFLNQNPILLTINSPLTRSQIRGNLVGEMFMWLLIIIQYAKCNKCSAIEYHGSPEDRRRRKSWKIRKDFLEMSSDFWRTVFLRIFERQIVILYGNYRFRLHRIHILNSLNHIGLRKLLWGHMTKRFGLVMYLLHIVNSTSCPPSLLLSQWCLRDKLDTASHL